MYNNPEIKLHLLIILWKQTPSVSILWHRLYNHNAA